MPAGSPLDALKARREELVAEAAATEIPVPGWSSPSIRLRIHPVEHPTLRKLGMRVEKAKGDAKANADLVSSAGVIFAATDVVVIGDGDDAAELGLADPRLAESLAVPADSAPLTVLRALCLGKDGTILSLAARIQAHSGYADLEADGSLAGE